MTTEEKDIIDLTVDLLEMPQISSAHKRPFREPLSETSKGNEKRRKTHGLVGEPFASKGQEKHYNAIQIRGMLVEVSVVADFDRQ